MSDPRLASLAHEIADLRRSIETDAAETAGRWRGWIEDRAFQPSAENLAQYLALRHHDLRTLQRRMMATGLSSLGRAESRVMPTLMAVSRLLAAATGGGAPDTDPASDADFFAGEARIAARADALLGGLSDHSAVRLMVTLPTQAADEPRFLKRLAGLGVEAVRINCAHDDETVWARMIDQLDRAAKDTGRRMKVMMDLPGPKIRTGDSRDRKGLERVFSGNDLAITRPGRLDRAPQKMPAIECTLAEALAAVEPGHRVYVDDGKLETVVREVEDWGVVVQVTAGPEAKGYKLKPEKGVNFPDTEVRLPALTGEDRKLLRFVARHADGIEYSFVQDAEDVAQLQQALAAERPDDWQRIGLVLKIETQRAVRNLPDILVRAAGRQPTAVMIARGDLAVEIGFARLAEMQEEILWLCEAAQVPVIWATQVLESFLKTGVSSRGEMTDAAMAARAECVMLNKGPFLFEGIELLDRLLDRMSGHISKKTHRLRPLRSW
ncbi:pyruvate kinase [Rhodobacter sp. Har01]|uniref:pyruvate kinase n=1 Tax=Rhodobacter sp. Har01 TaxID=2883999 RepID=UPI001D093A08|nr:pyruvate kinase [Rhodobacter sp. Har01]MCB6179784.1 pyruvate kinase [Rhodobacter sp. Har01]